MKMKRTCGILMPIPSLASRYGIGCLSKEAYDFVDFLEQAGQSFWQILPVGPTGLGDSPYQPFSAFAGNPYFIDPAGFRDEGLLTDGECERFNCETDPLKVDYGKLYNNRTKLLHIAYERFAQRSLSHSQEYREFLNASKSWLPDYALFRAYKNYVGGMSWLEWDDDMRLRRPQAKEKFRRILKDEIAYVAFEQFEFERQWTRLHTYANEHGIQIIGDLPFYVSMDSADAWSHPEVFRFDESLKPIEVAGCPPDAFSPTGQRWGNPVYDWPALKENGYAWWMKRLERNCALFDVVRIDHFHGFESYYAIPAEDETAENGEKRTGPGMDFFRALHAQLGADVPIIAEDLGEITPETEALLEETGYPGMNVLQYAFDWTEYSYYMTYNHKKHSVVYTGTHDNMTTRQWIESLNDHDRDLARRFIHSENTDYGAFVWDFIREAYRSPADLAIIPLQDYLVKGAEARLNTPGLPFGNWQWRLEPHFLSDELAQSIRALAKLYGRLPKQDQELPAQT